MCKRAPNGFAYSAFLRVPGELFKGDVTMTRNGVAIMHESEVVSCAIAGNDRGWKEETQLFPAVPEG